MGTVGVVGAGTMGAGIAQLAAAAGERTLVHDPDAGALERGLASARRRLEKKGDDAAAGRLEAAESLEAFAGCDVVIEAAPERLELKHELFSALGEIVGPDCVLATNTSSLPVAAVAAGAPDPARVVGMHFFNPAPVMKLVEVIAGEDSAPEALERVRELGRRMGKEIVDAADGPGFLVNRCNRPFGLEGARLVTERLASPAEVDRICRLGGGFRMGPFELMDLVGIDTGFEVSKSFAELSFGEPRWRPSPLIARLVAAGRHGRKTGRGWYAYADDGSYREEDPDPPAVAGGEDRLVVVNGVLEVISTVATRAAEAGFDVRSPDQAEGRVPWLILDDGEDSDPPAQGGPRAVLCAAASLAELDAGGSAAGFHLFATPERGGLVELTRSESTSGVASARAEELFGCAGFHTAQVGDAAGLVLGRIVAQVINEACFAWGEGVGSTADIDTGMRLGLNWPRGPFAWAEAVGLDHVLLVLEGLWDLYREERYRPAPALRRAVLAGRETVG